jgi:5-methylcytosine-specific restriction enzyme A
VVLATVAHHLVPHRGDWQLFIAGDLQSLCKRCHDSEAQAEDATSARIGQGASKV